MKIKILVFFAFGILLFFCFLFAHQKNCAEVNSRIYIDSLFLKNSLCEKLIIYRSLEVQSEGKAMNFMDTVFNPLL